MPPGRQGGGPPPTIPKSIITIEEALPPNAKTPFGDETVMECVAAPHTHTYTHRNTHTLWCFSVRDRK